MTQSDLVFVMPSDPSAAPVAVRLTDTVPVVGESVRVHNLSPAPTASVLLTADHEWGWGELRDYVVGQIVELHGVFPRNDKKEMGIFKSFLTRWGTDASPIARYAFEQMNGFWMGAPISVNRFCKGSDPYFAQRILNHLNWNLR
jgi:hypothetical protein